MLTMEIDSKAGYYLTLWFRCTHSLHLLVWLLPYLSDLQVLGAQCLHCHSLLAHVVILELPSKWHISFTLKLVKAIYGHDRVVKASEFVTLRWPEVDLVILHDRWV